ncbi:MAG TPA: hypothetical protein VJZ26_03210 [Blastocatellia bacterium]|nr:hypothetical protein [Blastocatellia bacterium]
MENKISSQKKARLIVVTVFVIGFAAGALSLNLYQRLTSASKNEPDPRDRTGVILKKMNDRMNLTSDQQNSIREILDETGKSYKEIRQKMEPCVKDFVPQFNAVRQQGREQIRAVLSENQLPKFEEMVEEQDKLRQEEREREKR